MAFIFFYIEFQNIVSLHKTNAMLIEITKDTGLAQIDKALKKLKLGKQFNAKKHCGKVKWDVDGITYQKNLRDEWS